MADLLESPTGADEDSEPRGFGGGDASPPRMPPTGGSALGGFLDELGLGKYSVVNGPPTPPRTPHLAHHRSSARCRTVRGTSDTGWD